MVELFRQKRVVSCNYCIAKDGKIGLVVDESRRSACSSSIANDNRAITIEVSSELYAPYKVTQEAYNSLIALLVDVCQRNNIPSLKWQGNPYLIGQVDKQNMTVHRWFSKIKSCPGDYLYNLHPAIVEEVNQKLTQHESEGNRSPSLYRVQVGAFHVKDNALAYLQSLSEHGFKGYIVEVNNG